MELVLPNIFDVRRANHEVVKDNIGTKEDELLFSEPLEYNTNATEETDLTPIRYQSIFTLPKLLPQTGTPLLERTYIKENDDLELEAPGWARPSSRQDIKYWKDEVLPFNQDKNADEYVVIPTIGVIAPINHIPEYSDDYDDIVADGTQIKDLSYAWWTNYLEYLDAGLVQYPATLPIGLRDNRGIEYIWNSVIFGHSSYWKDDNGRYKTIFGLLPTLDRWEEVWVYKRVGTEYYLRKYMITKSYETIPNDVSILLQENYDTQGLTLFTCTPIWGIEGRWIIESELISIESAYETSEELEVIEEQQVEEELVEIVVEEVPEELILEETQEETIALENTEPQKGIDYVLEEDFQACPIILNIQDPDYPFSKENIFSDITGIYNRNDILKFAQIGIVDGYDDGEFKPFKQMTRTEFLKVALISHCYTYKLEDPRDLVYIDVDTSTWQAKVIKKAESLWMINGDQRPDGTPIFRPNDIITKSEAVKILMNLSLLQATNPEELWYSDITINWQESYIRTGQTLGLFDPQVDQNLFGPDTWVQRQDMIDLIKRLVDLYR